MIKKIVLFTANTQGGIIQFTIQLYKVLIAEGCKVKVFIPQNAKKSDFRELSNDVVFYTKERKVLDNRPYKKIAEKIDGIKANMLWYMDDSVVCLKVGKYIKKTTQYLTVHDAGDIHPTNKKDIRTFVVNNYLRFLANSFYKKADKFILLSEESKKKFIKNYPKYSTKLIKMNLGAHLPCDEELMPKEMEGNKGKKYYLFFGRIDKYKGIDKLLRFYSQAKRCNYMLIIAGSGKLSDEEKKLAAEDSRVILINRYILDGEMKWLIHNSMAITLAYIEATQSGVIPLAYYYKKPVLVSNIAGLTQFVEDKKTGFICQNDSDWIRCFEEIDEFKYKKLEMQINNFYHEHMDWQNNIRPILESM